MNANVYSAPKGYEYTYVPGLSWEEIVKHDQKYLDRLKQWCKDHTNGKGKQNKNLVGETIRFGVADGAAIYMILNTNPLALIHCAIGDAWHANRILLRGLTLTDVKDMVENERQVNKLFGRK